MDASLVAPGIDEHIRAAVDDVVTEGRIAFNPPSRMRQGEVERVEVGIARSPEQDNELLRGLLGRGPVQLDDIETSPFMAVELRGDGFRVTALNPTENSEQLLRPTARWAFDVLPERSGARKLQVSVALRVPLPGRGDERISVPVLERQVVVEVDARYVSEQFLRRNWQWLFATGAGLAGAITAWMTLFNNGGG